MLNQLIDKFANLSNYPKLTILIIIDSLIILIAFYISISVRTGYIFYSYDLKYFFLAGIAPIICIIIFYKTGLYSNVIRYINFNVILKIFFGIFLYSIIWGMLALLIRPDGFPRSVIIINMFISLTLITNIRVLAKIFFDYSLNYIKTKNKNIIIYGINSDGISLFDSIKNDKSFKVLSFIDDAPEFKNRYIYNVKVRPLKDLEVILYKNKVHDIYITKQIKSKNELFSLSKMCDENNILIKTKKQDEWISIAPNGSDINLFEKIDPIDFLKRKIVESNNELITRNITNKVVLITGAGGSIGSEIASQSLDLNPSKIILFEQNEYALFKIKEKLHKYNKNKIPIYSILGSTFNNRLLEELFNQHNPYIIFHTAAYKHVGLVEDNIIESFYNNVVGTYRLIDVCQKYNIKNFVNISTDKAVLPTTFMGATKRICEMLIQIFSKKYDNTKFSIVRFGNVIGSSGSVIPIFQKQISEGGPVTVTDPEVKRYFMSISEAAQLVMQSSSLGQNGDIFLLDMGKSIKIYDLAKNMIDEYYKKNKSIENQIEIKFTGLPKHEKIDEDLYYGLNKKNTLHPKIFIDEQSSVIKLNFLYEFEKILNNYEKISTREICLFISRHIETYKFKIN